MQRRTMSNFVRRVTAAPLAALALAASGLLVQGLALPSGAVVLPAVQAYAQPACPIGAPKAAPGYAVSTFVSGLPYNANEVDQQFGVNGGACIGPWGITFSGATAFVTTSGSPGGLYRFGLQGGAANLAHEVDSVAFQGAPVWDRGHLYAIENSPDPNHGSVVELDPSNGVAERTLVSTLDCPQYLVANPQNGNLFTQDGCSGWPSSDAIEEVAAPASAHPVLKTYARVTGSPLMGGIAFAPDGVLYVITGFGWIDGVASGGGRVSQLVDQKALPGLAPGASAVAVAGTAADGQATSLWVTVFTDAGQDGSQLYLVNLTAKPASATLAMTATGSGSHLMGLTVGPHGCLYATSTSSVLRVSRAGQTCA